MLDDHSVMSMPMNDPCNCNGGSPCMCDDCGDDGDDYEQACMIRLVSRVLQLCGSMAQTDCDVYANSDNACI
jgi:hypothetical protein